MENIEKSNVVETWVKEYIKENNIKHTDNETLNKVSTFSAPHFGIFKDTEIYDAGSEKCDCLILSFLSCMSQTHRKCRYQDRMKIGNYYRRTYLPQLFNHNKKFFIDLYNTTQTKYFFIENLNLYILDNSNQVNLSYILKEENKYLPEIIIILLSKFYEFNLLTFTVPRYKPENYTSKNYNSYKPIFENNNSIYTISICGENTHFQVCKIKYNNNSPSFIINIGYNIIETFIQSNYKAHNFSQKYQNGDTFNYKNKKYTVFRKNYDFSLYENNGTAKIVSLVVYIKNEPVTIEHDTSKINESSIFVIHENQVKLYSLHTYESWIKLFKKNFMQRYVKIDGKIFKLYDINIDKLKNIQKNSEIHLTNTKNTKNTKNNIYNNTPPPLMPIIEQQIYKELNIQNKKKYEDILINIYYKVLEKNPELLKNKDNFDKIFFNTYVKPIIRSLKNSNNSIITDKKKDKIRNYIIQSINQNIYNHNYNNNLKKIINT
jgi:hypothetical protein